MDRHGQSFIIVSMLYFVILCYYTLTVGDAQFSDTESSSHTQQEQFERTRKCVELLKNQGYTCSDVTASGKIYTFTYH